MPASFARVSLAATAGWIVAALFCMLAGAGNAAQPQLVPSKGGATPELSLKALDGAVHELAQYRGRVVLVNFWATWCEPCRLEMPSIVRLRERLAGQPFVALAVNVDEPEARIRRYLKQAQLDLPILLDPNRTVTRRWNVRVLPATFIVGPDGRVRYQIVGELDWSDDKVVALVARLLNGG